METSEILQQVIMIVLQLLIPVVVAAGLELARQGIKWLRNSVGEAKWSIILQAVDVAVKATEQIAEHTDIIQFAEAKKDWAINEAQRILNERGFSGIDVNIISTLIEAALKDQVHKGPLLLSEAVSSIELG